LQKNRGFCFLEYDTHQAASQARRRLLSGRVKAWNNLIVTVDWADPINSPASDVMEKVKVLYVKNLATTVTEDVLVTNFSAYGEVEKAKKLKDYAFVHFKQREDARKAMEGLNGLNLEGQCIEICLAKPQDKKLKEKKLERQMQKQMAIR
jgi:heterogeneous nuclear ribonucleoprotein R